MRVLLLTNGPGEAWTWARPLAKKLEERSHQVVVGLLPCTFSSGNERSALEQQGLTLWSWDGVWRTWLGFRAQTADNSFDLVLQLGGDLLWGRWLSRRLQVPLIMYGYGPKKGMERCDLVTTAREGLTNGLVVGDLVLDDFPFLWQPEDQAIDVLFLPGSRPAIRDRALSFFQPLKDALFERFSQPLRPWVALSPFAQQWEQDRWKEAGFLVAPQKITLRGQKAVALTQPGTNNLQLAYAGIPSIVLAPYEFFDLVPLSGLKNFIPSRLRRWWLKRKIADFQGQTSWPNRLLQQEIFPELLGDCSIDRVVNCVDQLLNSWTDEKRKTLMSLADVGPGCDKLCDLAERIVLWKT